MKQRRAGVMVPLFSLTSSESWGVGEFRDVAPFAAWARAAGHSFVQILPITELPESETSPYSALTAMALDPIYIAVSAVEDFVALGGDAALSTADSESLADVRAAARVAYRDVRALKNKWLRRAYEQFLLASGEGTDRGRRFEAFCDAHAAWLDDYALFRALREHHSQLPWWEWPQPLANGDAQALEQARRTLAKEIGYRKYLQWIAAEQWAAARRTARPVQFFGDVPFMISADSPDVWRRQDEFRFDATVGVPPDAFSETGQDWGLPPWRWDVMAENDFAWMKMRAARTAELFDGFRLDHLVGLYRTYIRPKNAETPAFFAPSEEPTQVSLGERLVSLYAETGAEVIAEDLGVVPDFVRASLVRLGVPGFKVMRWERHWGQPGHPYLDPGDYQPISVAATGTHDTEPLITWWEGLDGGERDEVLAIPSVSAERRVALSDLDAIIRALLRAPSYLTIFPLPDLFAWSDRINTPAQVSDENWNWRLPWPVDQLLTLNAPANRAHEIARWIHDAGR